MKNYILAIGLFLAIAAISCSKSTIVGSDLLAQDQVDLGYIDTFSLVAENVLTDSVRTFTPEFNNQLVAYLAGNMTDPVFGSSISRIYADLRAGSEEPDFADAELDSVVLVLPYYAFSQYGDTLEMYGLEVHELADRLDNTIQYYSNADIPVDGLIGTSDLFRPLPNDSIQIRVHGGEEDETTDVIPQVRIRLDDSFGERILNEPVETFEDDSTYLANYPGIQISPYTVNAGMSAFNLRTASSAGIVVYYHQGDEFSSYTFSFNSASARTTTFEHDISGSLVEGFVNDKEKADSLLFLQGMSGVSFTLDIPNPDFFADKVINRAILEFTALTLPEDLGSPFDPVSQMILSEVTDTGLVIIQDVVFGLERNDLISVFGGNYNDEVSPATFTLNISAHLRKMSLGLADNKVQVTVLARPEVADRIVLAGPGHSTNPAKLKVNFTNL